MQSDAVFGILEEWFSLWELSVFSGSSKAFAQGWMMEEYVTYTQERSSLQTHLFSLWAADAVMNIKIGIKIMFMSGQYYYSF